MIRDETLCSFSEWVRPTSEEVIEAMDELNCSLQEWADLIGVTAKNKEPKAIETKAKKAKAKDQS